MKTLWQLLFGVICGLLAAGLILLIARKPGGTPIALLPPPTAGPLTVHVAGAVAAPGVYTLSAGARVQDAVQAAGGLLPKADPAGLNLAAEVEDGSLLVAPERLPTLPPAPTTGPVEPAAVRTPTTQSDFIPSYPTRDHPLNINTADQLGLEALPDIGPYRARQIIAYRTAHGPFEKIEDLLKVPGIPPETYEVIKDLVTVD